MPVIFKTVLLLILSNVFMTFAWYSHLKTLGKYAWYLAAIASWSIALFEYLMQVPANRIGYTVMSLPQLKILQEVITLSVFVPFTLLYMKETLTLNYLWACLCLLGQGRYDLDGVDRRGDLGQHSGLVAAPGADLQHGLAAPEP